MTRINVGRLVAGGLVASLVIWLLEGAASVIYMDDMQTALDRLGLAMEMTATTWFLTIVVSLIMGFALVFFYVAARPRFGPGPKTAAIVAVVVWGCGYLTSLIGYHMIGMYPARMLAMWAAVGLVEAIIAALAGAWVYREATS